MMHQPVNRSSCCHRIFKNYLPFAEWQIARNKHTASFVPMGKQGKKHLHFFAVLLDIAEVINHQYIIPPNLFEQLIKCQFLLGP